MRAVPEIPVRVPERPALAPSVELTGELKESGFVDRQWLIQRGGRFVQVTELLYRVCEHVDGERTLEEVAAGVSGSTEWIITADQVSYLIQTKLIPLGLVARESDTALSAVVPDAKAGSSPLGLNVRTAVIGPNFIDPITRVLQALYAPPVLVPVLAAVLVAHGWMYFSHGEAILRGLRDILYAPVLMLATLVVLMVAGVFHEFGHAAALRYGGGRVRGMGVGLYLVYPAIYTDTTDSYRLGRWARVRTDLGGFYFYLIFALGLIGLHQATGWDFLLLAVLLINLDIAYQSLPFVRFDGYWAVADLTGIPDLFTYTKPFVNSLRPGAGAEKDGMPSLKPWVRRVFAAYLLLTIPLLALLLYLFVTRAPGILAMTWDSYVQQGGALSRAFGAGDWVGVALSATQMVFLGFLLLGIAYMVYNLVRQVTAGLLRWSNRRRQAAVLGPTGAHGD